MPAHTAQRNQLVWLHSAAWLRVRARAWEAPAQAVLAHWQQAQLPLVVCRQRPPEGGTHISLGLPAPLQWGRIRLGVEVEAQDIARVDDFPLLSSALLGPGDAAQLHELLQHMAELQVSLRVYGSYGWQALSGLPCVRPGSDLDLLAHVPNLGLAGQVVWLLQGLRLGCRVDGELVFPNGWAVPWREYAQLIGGKVDHVLVKDRSSAQLLSMAQLRQSLRGDTPPDLALARTTRPAPLGD